MVSGQSNLPFRDFSTWEFLLRDVLEKEVSYLDFLKQMQEPFFEFLGTDRLPGPISDCMCTFLRETIPEATKLLLRIESTDANSVEAIVVYLEVVVLCIWAALRGDSTDNRARTGPASPTFPT
jgi:hypothetical protein